MLKNVKVAPPLSAAEIIIRALLAEGPRASREVLADLAARGFTPKQVRVARERQGIVTERGGFGQATRTTWILPLLPPAPTAALGGRPVRAEVRTEVRAQARIHVCAGTPAECSEMLASAAPAAASETLMPSMRRDPLQRSREIRTMGHEELRAYARQIGVRRRDIDELTEVRLRQNCMLTVAALVEAYMG